MKEVEFGVKSDIKDVLEQVDDLNKGLEESKEGFENAEKGSKALGKTQGAIGGVGRAFKSLGGALKGLGVLTVIVALFTALKEALGRNQKIMDAVATVMTTISNIFNAVVGALVDTYNWVTASTERFDGLRAVFSGIKAVIVGSLLVAFYSLKLAAQEVAVQALKLAEVIPGVDKSKQIDKITKSMKETRKAIKENAKEVGDAGKQIVDNAAEAVSEIKDIYNKTTENISKINVKAIYENAKLQTELKNTAQLAIAENRRLIEQYDIQAEKLRQTRDDESATIADRIKANEELGKVLEDQQKAMLRNADLVVAAAQMEADANKDNIELQAALTDALAERDAVIARVTGQQSEQLTNTNSLLKEQKDLERELFDFGMTAREQEMQELEQELQDKLELADKLGKGRKEIEEHYAKERVKLNKKFAEEDMTNQLQAASGLLKAMSSFAGDNKELAAASAIIDTYVGANKAIAQGGIPGVLAAAGIILTGLSNVRKIYATDVGDGGGGSTPSIDTAVTDAVESVPNPEIIQQTATLSGVGDEPVRAYVVTDDITDNQDKLNNIRRKATI